jgi:tripartite-type tricarboxylate transporter receptor subunit TctC
MRKTDLALGAAVLCMAAGPTFSQGSSAGWPVKPMRLVMPNAPGTGTDTLGRIVAQYLGGVSSLYAYRVFA